MMLVDHESLDAFIDAQVKMTQYLREKGDADYFNDLPSGGKATYKETLLIEP